MIDVVPLTKDDFDSTVLAKDSGFWFVRFYAPWCGHCKMMIQQWEETATKLKGEVNVANVDATVELALAKHYQIRGYPTMYLFYMNEVFEYRGGRSTEALTSFALNAKKALLEEKQPEGCQFKMKALPLPEQPQTPAQTPVKSLDKAPANLRVDVIDRKKVVVSTGYSPFYRWTVTILVLFILVLAIIAIYTVVNMSKGDDETDAEATSLLTSHDHKNSFVC